VSNTIIEEYYAPDAPKRYGVGRECQNPECRTKVTQYTEAVGFSSDPVILCNSCKSKLFASDLSPYQFVGIQSTPKGRKLSYPLPYLKLKRKERDLTQHQLATRVGCGDNHIMNIELERVTCSCKLAGKLARALGCSIAELKGEVA
jgi:DNA-binding XRE family transcriptional regulator